MAVLALGIAGVSTGAVLARLAEAPALAIATYRLVFANCAVLPAAAWSAQRSTPAAPSTRDTLRGAAAGVALALHFGLWIASLELTSVASSVALVTIHPLIVGVLAPLVLRERVRRDLWVGVILACVGSAVISFGDSSEPRRLQGDLLALGGGLAFAVYVMIGRGLRTRLALTTYLALVYSSAAMVLTAASLVLGVPLQGFATGTWVAFLAMAVVPQLVGHSSFNWALQHVSATTVSASVVGEVLGSTLLACAVLGEAPPGSALAGGALLLAGLFLAGTAEHRSAVASAPRT